MEFTNNYLEAIKFYRTFSNKNLSITTGAADQTPATPNYTPNPTPNWTTVEYDSYTQGYTYTVQQIQGINNPVTLALNWQGSFENRVYYKISGSSDVPNSSTSPKGVAGFTLATAGVTFAVVNNQYVIFGISAAASIASTNATVYNNTLDDGVIDTFTVRQIDTTPAAADIITTNLVLKLDANDPESYNGTGKTWYNVAPNALASGDTYDAQMVWTSGIDYQPGLTFISNTVNSSLFNSFAKGITCFRMNTPTVNAAYFKIPDGDGRAALLNAKKDRLITVQMWVNQYVTYPEGGSTNKGYFAKKFATNNFGENSDGYRFMCGTTWAGYSAQVQYEINGDAGSLRSTNFNGIIPGYGTARGPLGSSAWHMVTYITGYTSTTDATKIYVNGATVEQYTYGPENEPIAGPTASFVIGLYSMGLTDGGNGSPVTEYPIGDYGPIMVGAVYFYDGGLTYGDVVNNYNATKARYGL